MPTSNTRDCFRAFVGQRLVGLLFEAMPSHRADLKRGNTHLIFADGRALTLSNKGTYWVDSAEDVRAAIARKKAELDQTSAEIEEVLALAGELEPA